MKVAKIIGIPLLLVTLLFATTGGVFLAAFANAATNKDDIKLLLTRRHIYENLVKTLEEGTLQDFTSDQDQPRPDPAASGQADTVAIGQVVKRYLTPETYSRSVNTVVDSLYDWLDGKTDRPIFNVPLTEDKAGFQQVIIEVFTQRFRALPPCPAGTKVDPTFNPLETACQPPGYSDAQIQAFISEQTAQPEFDQLYNNAALSSEQIFKDINPEDSVGLQDTWRWLKAWPWIELLTLVGGSLLLGLLVFDRRKSLKVVGLSLLIPSGLMVLTSLGFALWINPTAIRSDSNVNNLVGQLAGGALGLINNRVLLYSGLIVAVATALLIASMIVKRMARAAAPIVVPTAAQNKEL